LVVSLDLSGRLGTLLAGVGNLENDGEGSNKILVKTADTPLAPLSERGILTLDNY